MRVLKLQIPKGQQPEFLKKFLGNRNGYQNRVLAIAAGLLFFTAPAMISGIIILAMLFLDGGYSMPRGANNEILFSNVVWDFVPRIAVTGRSASRPSTASASTRSGGWSRRAIR